MSRTGKLSGRACLAIAVIAGAGLLGVASNASAALLLPNAGVLMPPAPGSAGVTQIDTTGAVPLVTSTYVGTATSKVLFNDPANPFGPGFMTFTYEVSNTDNIPPATNLVRVTVSEYNAFSTDVSYMLVNGASVAPTSAERDSGDVIGFNYSNFGAGQIPPGGNSSLLVVHTNAPSYTTGLISVIDGTTATVNSFAPVPEPAALGPLGVAGLTLVRRRSR